jgi:hypothetical protein
MEIKPFKNQDYHALKNSYNRNRLFEDPAFPASNKSIYFSKSVPYNVTWKRPSVLKFSSNYLRIYYLKLVHILIASHVLAKVCC